MTLDEDWDEDTIFMYYLMKNYYQNNRNMYRSTDILQTHGISLNGASICDPLQLNSDGMYHMYMYIYVYVCLHVYRIVCMCVFANHDIYQIHTFRHIHPGTSNQS